jgi:hypothetical protein
MPHQKIVNADGSVAMLLLLVHGGDPTVNLTNLGDCMIR